MKVEEVIVKVEVKVCVQVTNRWIHHTFYCHLAYIAGF